ncbi:hypothetical protein KR222_005453, partial [Zaprionus bogoriensis]
SVSAVSSDGSVNAAVDKEVAPVGVVKADLLSLEQEIGGNPAAEEQAGRRRARSFLFSFGAGPAWLGGSLGYGYAGYGCAGYGYPGYGYGYPNYGTGYYPGVFGYQKIIIG